MDEFIFLKGAPSGEYKFSFTESLFNTEAHRHLQASNNWFSFFILNQKSKTVDGSIHFNLENGMARSPFKATHGGFDLNDGLPGEVILKFIDFIEEQLKLEGSTKIFIKLPLRISGEEKFDWVESCLMAKGFVVINEDIGGIIEVKSLFNKHIHRSEKKRLRKAIESQFQFDKEALDEIDDVYSFILQCRQSKKYDLSMSLSDMRRLAFQFPDHVLFFTVKENGKLLAASICLRVDESVLYDFYHDHDEAFDSYSPVVFLVKGINDYCFENKIQYLDLGTSMIGDMINTGLYEFKLKLGGKRAVKYSFEKSVV